MVFYTAKLVFEKIAIVSIEWLGMFADTSRPTKQFRRCVDKVCKKPPMSRFESIIRISYTSK